MSTRPPGSVEPPEEPPRQPGTPASGTPGPGTSPSGTSGTSGSGTSGSRADRDRPDGTPPADDDGAEAPAHPHTPAGAAWTDPADEETLRRLLRESVRDIEPSADALRALKQAVPARRRHRRRLLTAATTIAALAVGTPVTLQAASLGGSDARTVEAGHDQQADGTTGVGGGGDGPGTQAHGGTEHTAPELGDEAEGTDEPTPEESSSLDPLAPETDDPPVSSYPRCDREQLGEGVINVDPPDEDGLIYGSVRVANVSDASCRVRGTDELTVTVLGSGDAGHSATPQVVSRTEGDRASALPLPAEWHEELLLTPGEAYEVRFAWVPRRGAENGGCTVPADPEPPPGEDAGDVSGADASTGGETGTESEPEEEPAATDDTGSGGEGGSGGNGGGNRGETGGPEGPGSPGEPEAKGVTVRYTPAAGAPRAARVELPGVCGGTVYRTGMLPVPAP